MQLNEILVGLILRLRNEVDDQVVVVAVVPCQVLENPLQLPQHRISFFLYPLNQIPKLLVDLLAQASLDLFDAAHVLLVLFVGVAHGLLVGLDHLLVFLLGLVNQTLHINFVFLDCDDFVVFVVFLDHAFEAHGLLMEQADPL